MPIILWITGGLIVAVVLVTLLTWPSDTNEADRVARSRAEEQATIQQRQRDQAAREARQRRDNLQAEIKELGPQAVALLKQAGYPDIQYDGGRGFWKIGTYLYHFGDAGDGPEVRPFAIRLYPNGRVRYDLPPNHRGSFAPCEADLRLAIVGLLELMAGLERP